MSGNAHNVKFISGAEIGYAVSSSSNDPIGGTTEVQRMSLNDLRPLTVATFQGEALDVAWSPDGSSLAYIAYTRDAALGSGAANQLWLKTGYGPPRAITPLIPLFGRDGKVDDQTIVRFSHDGKYLLMVDTYVAGAAPPSPDQAIFQVRSVPDGGLVWVPPSALGVSGSYIYPYVTMAAWLHQTDRLYYRDVAGVHTWDQPGTVATLVAGLHWYSPSVSPDDRLVAYYLTANGQAHIEVRDLASNTVRVLPGNRAAPLFISNSVLFEGGGFVFDLVANAESSMAVSLIPIDVWPG